MSSWNEWISELLAKTELLHLVSKYVSLTKKGGTYWGCCPFHHEKTPSFTVSDSKGLFYCFGCQAGGNAINFLSKIESISRFDAIQRLADNAGMKVPQSEGKQQADYEKIRQKKQRLIQLLTNAAQRYHQNLSNPSAKIAIDYLKRRDISSKMIKRFGLGYSLGFEDIIAHLQSKGYTLTEMKEAGIAAQKADRYYDVFAKRLIVPIIDQKGDVIAFGGRLLQDSDFAKYRNSSQTLVFDKSRTIFAANLIKLTKQTQRLRYIILCEGYMDVIALHKAGFTWAGASMGTAVTPHQAKLLKNLCNNVYISFDGDAAGQKAALKGLDILQAEGLLVRVIVLPDGLDPDDVIKKYGADYYKKLIKQALPLTAFKIENLKKDHDISTPEGKSAFAVEAIRIIKALENPVEREEYLKLVQRATDYSMKVLYAQADLAQPEPTPVPISQSPEIMEGLQSTLDEAKEYILAVLAADKPYVNLSDDLYALLDDNEAQRIFLIISEARKRPNYSPGQLYSLVDESDEPIINRLANYEFKQGDSVQKYGDCINKLKTIRLDKQIAKLTKEYNQSKKVDVLVSIRQLTSEKEKLKSTN